MPDQASPPTGGAAAGSAYFSCRTRTPRRPGIGDTWVIEAHGFASARRGGGDLRPGGVESSHDGGARTGSFARRHRSWSRRGDAGRVGSRLEMVEGAVHDGDGSAKAGGDHTGVVGTDGRGDDHADDAGGDSDRCVQAGGAWLRWCHPRCSVQTSPQEQGENDRSADVEHGVKGDPWSNAGRRGAGAVQRNNSASAARPRRWLDKSL